MSHQSALQQEMRWRKQAALQHVELWVARLGERFTCEHDEVQHEIREEALDRLWSGGAIAWQGPHVGESGRLHPGDTECIRQRVVSRHRVRAYGALPDNFDEWQRQTNEIRRGLGMAPIGDQAAQRDPLSEPMRAPAEPRASHVWVMPDGRRLSAAERPEGALSLREWRQAPTTEVAA